MAFLILNITMIVEPKEIRNIKIHDGQTVGLTSGCFDLVHYYHLHYLLRCHAKCDVLIVGVDSDDMVKENKKHFPIMPEYHRAAMIAAMRCVDAVFILRSLDDLKLAGASADYLFKNGETIYGQKIIGAETAKLVIIEDVIEVQSTTALKEKIRNAS